MYVHVDFVLVWNETDVCVPAHAKQVAFIEGPDVDYIDSSASISCEAFYGEKRIKNEHRETTKLLYTLPC